MKLVFISFFVAGGFVISKSKSIPLKEDGFVVSVGCKSGYGLTLRSGDLAAYFMTTTEISTPAYCSTLPKGHGHESCVSKSRSMDILYFEKAALEHPHAVIDCTPDYRDNHGPQVHRYLQKFQMIMEDISGPFSLNYTCCGIEYPVSKYEDCSLLKVYSDEKQPKPKLDDKVKGSFIKVIQYMNDKGRDDSWYTEARICYAPSDDLQLAHTKGFIQNINHHK